MELRKIIVGMDFSPAALAATHDAIELARHTGAELVLVHVGAVLDAPIIEGPEGTLPEWEQVIRARTAEERKRLHELRDRLAGQSIEVSTCVIDGFVYLGSSLGAFVLGHVLPQKELAKQSANWWTWPAAMLPAAVIGLVLATRVWNARPSSAKAAAH